MVSDRYQSGKRPQQPAQDPVYSGYEDELKDFKKFHCSLNLCHHTANHSWLVFLATTALSAGSMASLLSR